MTMHVRRPYSGGADIEYGIGSFDPLMHSGWYRGSFKRVMDLCAVALLAVPTLLIILPLAAIIALDGASPFYRQTRLGKDGKTFSMWKLRSMVPDADARLASFLERDPEAAREWAHSQKLRHDPRITKIGHIIRRSSLDELPQLLNVLRGEMSLVGPRPMMVSQRSLYPGSAYFLLQPGITGYWQVSERNETSFAERAIYDTAYYRDLSLVTDLRVMLRTIWVVAHGTGC